jgi:hypothetical protein
MGVELHNLAHLCVFQRQYFQLVEPSQLRWPQDSILKSADVQSWMFTNLFDSEGIKSPPPERYQLRVLKLLISKLERSIVDPEEDVRFPFSFSSTCFRMSCGVFILSDLKRRRKYDVSSRPVASSSPANHVSCCR